MMTKKLLKEVRVRDILDAAQIEFTERGYDQASMERIAARAGLTKGGLYHHFNSKDQILAAVNDLFQEPITQIIRDALSKSGPAESLHHYIQEYLGYWMNHQGDIQIFLMYMTRALSNPAMLATLKDYYAQELSFFEQIYSSGIESGDFLRHDPKSMALALTSALDGIIAYLLAVQDLSLDRVLEVFDQIFIRSVCMQPPSS